MVVYHEAGKVNRDLKPANLIVTDDGTVKLIDRGLEESTDKLSKDSGGTALTISPEGIGQYAQVVAQQTYGSMLFQFMRGHIIVEIMGQECHFITNMSQ